MAQDKTTAYGEILIQYRRGMISHHEMMAQCDAVEQAIRERDDKINDFARRWSAMAANHPLTMDYMVDFCKSEGLRRELELIFAKGFDRAEREIIRNKFLADTTFSLPTENAITVKPA